MSEMSIFVAIYLQKGCGKYAFFGLFPSVFNALVKFVIK